MSKLRNIGSKWPSRALTTWPGGIGRRLAVRDELAVAAIAHPFGGGLIPEVARRRPGDLVKGPLRRIRDAAIAAVAQRPDPLDEIAWRKPPSTIRARRR